MGDYAQLAKIHWESLTGSPAPAFRVFDGVVEKLLEEHQTPDAVKKHVLLSIEAWLWFNRKSGQLPPVNLSSMLVSPKNTERIQTFLAHGSDHIFKQDGISRDLYLSEYDWLSMMLVGEEITDFDLFKPSPRWLVLSKIGKRTLPPIQSLMTRILPSGVFGKIYVEDINTARTPSGLARIVESAEKPLYDAMLMTLTAHNFVSVGVTDGGRDEISGSPEALALLKEKNLSTRDAMWRALCEDIDPESSPEVDIHLPEVTDALISGLERHALT